MGFEFKII